MIHSLANCFKTCQEKKSMYDLLIALAFVGMVIAPAIVAASAHSGLAEK